jgi:hypothetical protein
MPRQIPLHITDAQWRVIERTLPAAADKVYARNKLEQIARHEVSPRKMAAQCEQFARLCSSSLVVRMLSSDEDAALLERLIQRGEIAQNHAQACRRFAELKRPRFYRHCLLLWLWVSAGGDLKIRRSNPPIGPVVAFLQAADMAVFRKPNTLSAWQVRSIVKDFRKRAGKIYVNATVTPPAVA